MVKQKAIKSTSASKEKQKWQEFIWEEKQKTPARLENAAQSIGAIISITLTLIISLLHDVKEVISLAHYKTVIILWLIASVLAFFIIFPFPYRYSKLSINSFIQSHNRTITIKYISLIVSTILYLSGMILLVNDVI